jgi:hypothetical protein
LLQGPVSKIFKKSFFNFNLKLVEVTLSWRHHGSWRWRWKQKCFWDRKMNLLKVYMKYGHLVVFIRHDSALIWGFRYSMDSQLALVLLKLSLEPVFSCL